VRISISPPLSIGIKAYVEMDDAKRVQWIVVRGTSSLINIRLDVDYNKVVESRLQIPLHKGFADAALQVYQFAKPLLKTDYETRVTGHSFGGGAAVIVLMLLKEDGFKLGQTMTFGQPKVTNSDGARKYRTLPLLRFVNDNDPVPLLPPIRVVCRVRRRSVSTLRPGGRAGRGFDLPLVYRTPGGTSVGIFILE